MTNEPTASIDDLLHDDDDTDDPRAGAPRPRSPLRQLIRAVLTAGALTGLLVYGLLLIGVQIAPLPVFAGFLALLLLRRAVRQVAAPPLPTRTSSGRGVGPDDGWQGHDALRAAVRRWEVLLDAAHSDPGRFSRTVLPLLAELTDERLRQRHGCTRDSDPARARELLGEPLWRLLTDPGRPPRRRELAAHLQTLEGL